MSKVLEISLFVFVLFSALCDVLGESWELGHELGSVKNLGHKKRSATIINDDEDYDGSGASEIIDSNINPYQPYQSTSGSHADEMTETDINQPSQTTDDGLADEMTENNINQITMMEKCRLPGTNFDECMNSGASHPTYVCSVLLVFLRVVLRVY